MCVCAVRNAAARRPSYFEKGGTMDSRAFDELSKQLAEKTSRGRALKLFGGALVGTLVGAGSASAHPPEKHCKYARYSCQRNIDCCSNNCCNRICCDDGQTCCGGECITCPAGQTVDPNTCQCTGGGGGPVCGNGVCEPGEDSINCPQDCPPGGFCGDGACDPAIGEDCNSCPEDCGPCTTCGNGVCEPEFGENSTNCPEDCPPINSCGNGICDPGTGEDVFTCPQDCPEGVCPPGGDACVGTAGACSTANPNCACLLTVEGDSTCVDFTSASSGCVTSLDCPLGQVCINVAGCGGITVCMSPC